MRLMICTAIMNFIFVHSRSLSESNASSLLHDVSLASVQDVPQQVSNLNHSTIHEEQIPEGQVQPVIPEIPDLNIQSQGKSSFSQISKTYFNSYVTCPKPFALLQFPL